MSWLDENPDKFFDDQELAAWLAFDQSSIGVGIAKIKMLFENFGSIKAAWKASEAELADLKFLSAEIRDDLVFKRKTLEPEKLLAACKAKNVDVIPYFHPNYPPFLREIYDPPMVLYVRGHFQTVDFLYTIAIVGTRKLTGYGKTYSKTFAHELAQRGITVVSGMAIGIDSIAHWGAIDANGRTIAVLACGPDICYPTSNRPLYQKIIEEDRGVVLSEFFPGTKPEPWRFPARNRIISGLSRGVIVIEAGDQSGALITAELAFQQSRSVFALPGRLDSPGSEGTNRLIKTSKAQLVTNVSDVLSEFQWESGASGEGVPCVVELFGREREIYEMISHEPVHFDYLCEKSGMAAGELSATLTMLELAGIVDRQVGDWYSRCGTATIVSSGE